MYKRGPWIVGIIMGTILLVIILSTTIFKPQVDEFSNDRVEWRVATRLDEMNYKLAMPEDMSRLIEACRATDTVAEVLLVNKESQTEVQAEMVCAKGKFKRVSTLKITINKENQAQSNIVD